ncbi:hypothetical protein COLO4_20843 [Corchorus olitorius]|uniref:Uncharacterized protein n=1 Tax=Corchorus olitorius TaxID=93759 RepID=A0A1R3IWK9_9ROSI|nr:hypothetical protein COLO4_20843 [Corchorus olitorius]
MGFPDLEGTTATKVADAAALEANQFKTVDVFSQSKGMGSSILSLRLHKSPLMIKVLHYVQVRKSAFTNHKSLLTMLILKEGEAKAMPP